MTDSPTEKTQARILIVEDEILFAASISKSLKKLGYEIARMVTTPAEAIQAAHELAPDLILMDIKLGELGDGIETYEQIRADLDIPVIYLSAYSDKALLERARLTEPYGYLSKPVSFKELRNTIETSLYKHEAYRRVKRSEALLAKAEKLASLGSWELDVKTGELFWSDESFRAFGYDRRQVSPSLSKFLESVHPDDSERVLASLRAALLGNRPYDIEFRIVRPDGTVRVLHSRGDVLFDNAGLPSRMVGMALDVTERKQAEDLIKAQRDLAMALSAASNLEEALGMCLDTAISVSDMDSAGIYVMNENSGLDLILHKGVSERFLNHVRHMPAELPESQMVARGAPAYYGERLSALSPKLAKALKQEGFRSSSVIPIVFQGRVILSLHLSSRKAELVPPHIQRALETIAAQIGAAVTRIRAEAEVRRSREILEAFISAADDALALVDREKRLVVANRAWNVRFGKEDEAVKGNTTVDISPPGTACERERLIDQVFETKKTIRNQYSSGGRHYDSVLNPVLGSDGEVHSVAVFSRDMTEHKLAQTALKEAKDLAEAASRAKTDFLTNMSHELRTPLNAIIGFSEVLQDELFGPLNARQAGHVRHIVESGHHLLELISDILDLSRIEAGGMRLETSLFDVLIVLQNSVDIVSEAARRKCIELATHWDKSDEPLIVEADEVKLRQVVLNLLSNAVKFTPERGRIDVRAHGTSHEAAISVSDTGIGLRSLDRERIFNAFEQVDTSTARREQGSGLGLSLARKLIEMHGGKIWAESPGLGKGTTFTLTIPREYRGPQCA